MAKLIKLSLLGKMYIPPEFLILHHCGSHAIFQKNTTDVMICKSQPLVIHGTDFTTASCLLND